MTPMSNTAEIAVLDQSAVGREAPTDRNRAMSMSPISVPQVLHVAMAIQYQGLLSPNRYAIHKAATKNGTPMSDAQYTPRPASASQSPSAVPSTPAASITTQ